MKLRGSRFKRLEKTQHLEVEMHDVSSNGFAEAHVMVRSRSGNASTLDTLT